MLNLEKAYKIYDKGNTVAINDVSLNVLDGEYISVVGESGSGKTTLMNILGCLDVPTIGHYFIDGQDVSLFTKNQLSEIRNRKIGFIFQNFNLIDKMTAVENVALPLVFRGIPKNQRQQIAVNALESVGLSKRLYNFPSEMSGGQQQRVAIARAIAGEPSVILADEPTGNLDKTSANAVLGIIDDLSSKGNTIVLITHDTEVSKRAHKIVEIKNGKLII